MRNLKELSVRLARSGAAKAGAVGAFLGSVGMAHAELPAAAQKAVEDAGADLTTAITLVIVAMVAFWGLRKVGQKLGWI